MAMSDWKRIRTPNPVGTPISAKDIAIQAEGFAAAIDCLASQPAQFAPHLAFPSLVLSAFASELFFKCIIFIESEEQGKPPHGHFLHTLFGQMSEDSQKRIKELWEQQLKQFPKLAEVTNRKGEKIALDLDLALREGNDAFEELRYTYENNSETVFVLFNLPLLLRMRLFEMKPEWTKDGKLNLL